MSSLPIEIWHQIFSLLDEEGDQAAVYNLCLVCKTFNAICKPFLYRRIKGQQLLSSSLLNTLDGPNGNDFSSWVEAVDVPITLRLVDLTDEPDWEQWEIDDALHLTEIQTRTAFSALSHCNNVKSLHFGFEFEDMDTNHKGDLLPEDFNNHLPSVRAVDLLSMPCISSLRNLRLQGRASEYFNLTGFGELIANAERLESLELLEVDLDDLLDSLRQHLAIAGQTVLRPYLRVLCKYKAQVFRLAGLGNLPIVGRLELEVDSLYIQQMSHQPFAWDNAPFRSITSLHLSVSGAIMRPDNVRQLSRNLLALESLHLAASHEIAQVHAFRNPTRSASAVTNRLKSIFVTLDLQGSAELFVAYRPASLSYLKTIDRLLNVIMSPSLENLRLLVALSSLIPATQWMEYVEALQEVLRVVPMNVEVNFALKGMDALGERVHQRIERKAVIITGGSIR